MGGLIRAEFRKLRSTQLWFWMLVAVVALTALLVVAQIIGYSHDNNFTDRNVRGIFTSAQTASIAALVLGVLAVTTEFRYQTITPTLLTTPSRLKVVGAKMIAYTIVGAAYAAVTILVSVLIAYPWLTGKHIGFSFADAHAGSALIGVFFAVTLWSLVGLGFGALVRNQVVAVVVAIVYSIVIEPILSAIPGVRVVYPYLPGGATAAILDTSSRANPPDGQHYTLLSPALGCLILVLWAAGFAVLGATLSLNRDIT